MSDLTRTLSSFSIVSALARSGTDQDSELGDFLFPPERQSSRASADAEGPHLPPPPPHQALVRPEDLVSRNPADSLRSVRTLVKQQADPDQFRTTSALIGCSLEPPESSGQPF